MESEKKPILSIVFLIFSSLILLGGCAPKAQTETIDIGAIFMLTGVGSYQGVQSLNGARMAIEEINSEGGINGTMLNLIPEDNKGDDAPQAITALNKLLSSKVKVILGPNWATSSSAVAPIACSEGALMFASSGNSDFNEMCDSLFTLFPHNEIESRKLGQYIYDQGFRRLAILGSAQSWEEAQARYVREGFENAGGKVVVYELPPKDDSDFMTSALKISEADPDAVYLQFTFIHLASRQLRQAGVKAPFFAVLVDDDRIKGSQGALEGTQVISSFTPTDDFVRRYFARYNSSPDLASDTFYDSVKIIAQAMAQTNSTDPGVLKQYLGNLKSYKGASGDLTFDGKRAASKPSRFMVVKGNKLKTIEKEA